MVRFQQKRPTGKDDHYFPYYKDQWTSYDPLDTANCSERNWVDIWEADADRDRLHRKNSYYYSREVENDEELQESPTLAIILFGSIIFCLFVPQIIDLLITVFCPGPLPPSSPPTPPPGPKGRKQLRMYHYAIETKKDRKRHSSIGSQYHYDPDNIFNYVSTTRIRTLNELSSGNDMNDESDREGEGGIRRKKKSRHSKTISVKEPVIEKQLDNGAQL